MRQTKQNIFRTILGALIGLTSYGTGVLIDLIISGVI